MHNKIIFAHCTYKPLTAPLPDDFPGPGNFSLKYCNLKSRVHAFAYRHYRLEKEEDTCIDRHEQVDCHESLTEMRKTSPWKTDISKKCIGVAGEPFTTTNRHHVGAIPVDGNLETNTIVHSSELIFYCPKCTAKSKPFSINSECYKSVATLTNGWPSAFYNCDDFTSIDNHECGG
uniref:Uncharacterized protein n=1 Tax=Panagrolaimus sp. JU765 TaxID=591449 RepID=A0AC34RAP7_9BILA